MADDHRGALAGFDGEFAILTRCTRLALFALLANGNLVVEGNLDSIVLDSSFDIAIFGNGTISIVDGITLDGDGIAQRLRYFATLSSARPKPPLVTLFTLLIASFS